MEDWLLGMLLVFLGCCCSAVGLVLLKHSTNVEEHLPLTKRPFWFIGACTCLRSVPVVRAPIAPRARVRRALSDR